MLDMPQAKERSGYTDEELFDWGISGVLRFLVVVPELGACSVPDVALSHFMAGAPAFDADALVEHYSGALSGAWTIQRANLRILADSWHALEKQGQQLLDAAQQATVSEADSEALWHDVNLDAGYWLNLSAVRPHEAALLLAGQNPHEANAADSANGSTLQDGPNTFGPLDFKRLERAFVDISALDNQSRDLRAWRDCAKAQGLAYHWWIDRYIAWSDGYGIGTKPFDGLTIALPARPVEIPASLSALDPAEHVQLQWNHAGSRSASIGSAAAAVEAIETVIKRQSLGRFTMREAAEIMAQAHGLDASDFLNSRMLPAFQTGLLKLIDPKDGGPVSGRSPRDFDDWVIPENLNGWLEAAGFIHRWPIAATQNHAMPASSSGDHGLPPALKTGAMRDAFSFADLGKAMGDVSNHKWLLPARVTAGKAPVPHTWNPVKLAELLLGRGEQESVIRRAFQTEPALRPWLTTWNDFCEQRRAAAAWGK